MLRKMFLLVEGRSKMGVIFTVGDALYNPESLLWGAGLSQCPEPKATDPRKTH